MTVPGAAVRIASAEVVPGGAVVTEPDVPQNARAVFRDRRGLVFCVRDRDGRVGLGEASPLPGFSPDTLEQCAAELAGLAHDWSRPAGAMTVDLGDIPALAARVTRPAARFAVECALLDLLGQQSGQSMAELLCPAAPVPVQVAPRVPVNALIRDVAQAFGDMDAGLARGIDCFKVKIGADLERELEVLARVRARHGAAVSLRLDANRAWPAADLLPNLARLAPLAPEYVEEPAAELASLAALGACPVAVALDESLAGADPGQVQDLLARRVVRALVLKPMLLGGLFHCLELMAMARAHGAYAVVSHLVDGPVALAACGQLALVAGTVAGLDPHPGLAAWPDVPFSWMGDGYITAPDAPGLGLDAGAATRLLAGAKGVSL